MQDLKNTNVNVQVKMLDIRDVPKKLIKVKKNNTHTYYCFFRV